MFTLFNKKHVSCPYRCKNYKNSFSSFIELLSLNLKASRENGVGCSVEGYMNVDKVMGDLIHLGWSEQSMLV